MKLIGLTGKAGVGKDTVADHLCARYGYIKYSLASPIKRMLDQIIPAARWNDREWKESTVEWLGASPRQLAQTLGTEWGRQLVRDDLWLMLAGRFIHQTLRMAPETPGIVVPDIRFENEAAWLRDMSGELWHVIRRVPGVRAHVSEAGVEKADEDRILYNHKSIFDLVADIGEALSQGEHP